MQSCWYIGCIVELINACGSGCPILHKTIPFQDCFACNLNYCVVIASLAMPAIKLKTIAFTIISRVSALEGVPDTVGQSDDGEDVLSGA